MRVLENSARRKLGPVTPENLNPNHNTNPNLNPNPIPNPTAYPNSNPNPGTYGIAPSRS